MPKAERGTPKDIANRIKAKGLQKLKFYCEMCKKQCRDANGFKCHMTSESHLRQMKIFSENAHGIVDRLSREFETNYLETLRRRHTTKRVNANNVYQQVIQDKQHVHMNATRWVTLSDFVQYLGKSGKCVVDETERGWYVQYIERDASILARKEAQQKRVEAEKLAEQKHEQRMELQRREAAKQQQQLQLNVMPTNIDEKANNSGHNIVLLDLNHHPTKKKTTSAAVTMASDFFNDDDDDGDENDEKDNENESSGKVENDPVDHRHHHNNITNKQIQSTNSTNFESQQQPIVSLSTGTITTKTLLTGKVADQTKKKRSITNDHDGTTDTYNNKKKKSDHHNNNMLSSHFDDPNNNYSDNKRNKKTNDDNNSIVDNFYEDNEEEEEPPWILPDILVRIISKKKLSDGNRYFKQKAVIDRVCKSDPYTAKTQVLADDDGGDGIQLLRIHQDDLETVVGKEKSKVRLLRGKHRGQTARVVSLNKKKYKATLKLKQNKKHTTSHREEEESTILLTNVDFEDFSQIA